MIPIHIYYHMALIGRYEEVIRATVAKIVNSDLYISAETINACVLSDGNRINLDKQSKIQVLYESKDLGEYEYPTLKRLHEHSKAEDAYFLYIHTKGVSDASGGNCSSDWRNYMEYFVIERWLSCVKLLGSYDTVGVNWKNEPYRHYSGNFWWSKSSYLRTLQPPDGDRFGCESWIGSGNVNACSLHNSNLNHYHVPYPRSMYEVK